MKKTVGRLLRLTASLELTVFALMLFMALVILGTVYQASHGLYAAQKEIFHAWYTRIAGILPLPGLVTAGALLTFNLLMALAIRIRWSLGNAGILLVHLGLIVFLAGGFVSRRLSQESYLTLAEGEAAAYSLSYQEWELALWPESLGERTVSAIPIRGLRAGEELNFRAFNLVFRVKAAFTNSRLDGFDLKPVVVEAEPERNIPGLVLQSADGEMLRLFGGSSKVLAIHPEGKPHGLQLRLRRFPLPVTLKLIDFRKITYSGSEIAKSFESQVEVVSLAGFKREVRISMNRPLRIGAHTFYQSSYDQSGPVERSTFSVVHNSGRLLPYYASLLTFLGLLWFAIQRLSQSRVEKKTRIGGPHETDH